ncbi:MAG: hypothetical protein NTW64_00120 [Candidatus Omnitrophica bacterium]|nr:hypothetical protein [Candidatus Omnitrophota bacterium]
MKKIIPVLLAVIFFFSTALVTAQGEEKKEEIPPGMEIVVIGGSRVLVPKDVRSSKRGDLIVIEPAHEYVARKVAEMEERLVKIETKEEELGRKIEQINQILRDYFPTCFSAISPTIGSLNFSP